MKIKVFMENYSPGGLDTFVANLINNWPFENDRLALICNHTHTGLKALKANIKRPVAIIEHRVLTFSRVFSLPQKEYSFLNSFLKLAFKIFSPILKYLLIIYSVFALRKILLEGNPDKLLVINGGYPACDSCRAATISWGIFNRQKSIHNFHSLAVPARWHLKIQEYLTDSFVCRYTKVFLGISKAAADSLLCRDALNKRSNISYVYNGIEAPQNGILTDRDSFKCEIGIPLNSLICMMLANYDSYKGHNFLLQAFKKVTKEVPLAYLLIYGSSTLKDKQRVAKLVQKFGLSDHVRLMNFNSNIDYLLSNADILLVASQAYEAFGLTSVEAMAHRVPVVATKVGGIPEVVNNGEGGFCIGRKDINLYAGTIIRLLSDENLRKTQGEKGFKRYQELFTAKRMAQEYAKIVRN